MMMAKFSRLHTRVQTAWPVRINKQGLFGADVLHMRQKCEFVLLRGGLRIRLKVIGPSLINSYQSTRSVKSTG
jgi:hypothetical protein